MNLNQSAFESTLSGGSNALSIISLQQLCLILRFATLETLFWGRDSLGTSEISEAAKLSTHWLSKIYPIFSKLIMLSHYCVSEVIVACLKDFPTAFNGVLKSLLRYISPRIVSVVHCILKVDSRCPPGLFPFIEDWIKTTFLWILPTVLNPSTQWHENKKINRQTTFHVPVSLSRTGVKLRIIPIEKGKIKQKTGCISVRIIFNKRKKTRRKSGG